MIEICIEIAAVLTSPEQGTGLSSPVRQAGTGGGVHTAGEWVLPARYAGKDRLAPVVFLELGLCSTDCAHA